MSEVFNRHDENHIRLAKGLYYSWYGPKDASNHLAKYHSINASPSLLTRLFFSFRAADIPKYERSRIFEKYLANNPGV